MKASAFHTLRIGVAITFLWIGVLILRQPEAWGGYLQPWAVRLIPFPIAQVMISTALLDIAIGALLLVNVFTWIAALAGALHVVVVLTTSGITDITVRDIAILAATAALAVDALPKTFEKKCRLLFSTRQES